VAVSGGRRLRDASPPYLRRAFTAYDGLGIGTGPTVGDPTTVNTYTTSGTSCTSPTCITTHATFDVAGRPVTSTDAQGQTTSYYYMSTDGTESDTLTWHAE
jgi:YD repeat-containing protein